MLVLNHIEAMQHVLPSFLKFINIRRVIDACIKHFRKHFISQRPTNLLPGLAQHMPLATPMSCFGEHLFNSCCHSLVLVGHYVCWMLIVHGNHPLLKHPFKCLNLVIGQQCTSEHNSLKVVVDPNNRSERHVVLVSAKGCVKKHTILVCWVQCPCSSIHPKQCDN